METLAKAVERCLSAGAALPAVYKPFADEQIVFRKSATSMVVAPPGRFKSALALNLAIKWALDGCTVLYLAADSDPHTVGKRCAAILTGKSIDEIEPDIKTGMYREALSRINGIHWEFRSMDISSIERRLLASDQMYGSPADVVIVDNLINMVSSPGDWHGQIQFCKDVNELAVAQQTHIMMLHHTHLPTGEHAFEPLGEKGVQGQLTQFPRLALSMNCFQDQLKVAVIKNTNGRADPSGETWFPMQVNTSNFRITGAL
jgi:AAA domain